MNQRAQRVFWVLGLLALTAPVRASEGETVTYLALFEISGDGVHDQLARDLSAAVRRSVAVTAGYQLSDARVSLEQLSLVQDCDAQELSCLAKIAKPLGVSGFIFGQLQREGSGAFAQLSLFDTASQTIKRTARAMFASRKPTGTEIERKSDDLVGQLLGAASPPAPEPTLPSTLPEPGAAADAEPPVAPAESDGISTQQVAGYALLGGAALSVGLSVLAFVEIDRAQTNENLDRYRRAVGRIDPKVEDVCDEAEGNQMYGLPAREFEEVKSECGVGRTFEVLQFIFLGAAAVSGGLSAYLLLSDEDSVERKPQTLVDIFPIQPIVGFNSAEVRAKLRF